MDIFSIFDKPTPPQEDNNTGSSCNWFMGYIAFFKNNQVLVGNFYGTSNKPLMAEDIPVIESRELERLQREGTKIDRLVATSFNVF